MNDNKNYIRWIRSKVGNDKIILVFASGDEAHSIVIGYELKAIGGKLFCDGGETLELKYFAADDMPELFCKQHEEFWCDIKKEKFGS